MNPFPALRRRGLASPHGVMPARADRWSGVRFRADCGHCDRFPCSLNLRGRRSGRRSQIIPTWGISPQLSKQLSY